jgi:hypothetical protein
MLKYVFKVKAPAKVEMVESVVARPRKTSLSLVFASSSLSLALVLDCKSSFDCSEN